MRLLRLTSLVSAALACVAAAASAAPRVPALVFPVVGAASYGDDFGDPRGASRHEGNDILADRRAPAVAAEGGTVSFWTTSARAGCMLYLKGDSGTEYSYVHLNNDLGPGNDNRGRCVPGVAYAPGLADGARVEAGELVAYVGDSGDADGTHPHLHFEVHPGGGGAVDPFRLLRRAQRLLFPAGTGSTVTLTLSGRVVARRPGALELDVQRLQAWPSRAQVAQVDRTLVVRLPRAALVRGRLAAGAPVVVLTAPGPATEAAQRGEDGVLVAASVVAA